MSNIRKNINNIFDLRINRSNYFDLQLSQDNVQCFNCSEIISGDVVASFDFDNDYRLCSPSLWDKAVSFNQDICDIGLTGIDNRFVPSFSGETYNPMNSTDFCITRVSGDVYCYQMNVVDESIGNPRHIQFCGGFYQGFYKLHEYDFQVLPNEYTNGWTKEFWLKKEDCPSGTIITVTGETITYIPTPSGQVQIIDIWSLDVISGGTCTTKPMLNEVYPENDNIFYFWGLRAENKFCMFSPTSGLTTCTGIPLASEIEVIEFEPQINPFLYYNRRQLCQGQPNPTIEHTDCCDSIINNAMAFRINDDNGIGIRLLTTTGECMVVDGITMFSGTPIVEEFYSKDNIISDDIWHHIVYRFTPYEIDECKSGETYGELAIFVDGFLKLKIDDFPEFKPYPLDEHRDKQLGVPYNISIGGGTQGLLESIPSGNTHLIGLSGYTACDYVTNLVEPCQFGGISINGQEILSPPLDVSEHQLIELWLEMHINRIQGGISVDVQKYNNRNSVKIRMNGVIDTIDYIILSNGGRLCVSKLRCYDVPPHEGRCGILEEYFAGTFIGSIAEFRLHERPLCFSEIKCNFNLEKEKYNRHRDKPQCY